MKKVKEIMTTEPFSCQQNETIQTVANQMSKSNVGFLPVVDDSKKVIGTITDRDVALAMGNTEKSAKDIKVQEVMNQEVHTISPEDDATTALKIMRTKQVGRLPVIDKEQHLTGVVSLMGIARKIKNTTEKDLLERQGDENIVNTFYSIAERNANGRK